LPPVLDAMSGELYASAPMVLVESSRWVRDAALSRARDSLSSLSPPGQTTSGVWIQALNGNGTLRGDDNAGRTRSSTDGWLVGIDHAFDGRWRAGVMGGVGRTNAHQDATRAAKARMRNQHLGAYVGHAWGAWDMRAGLSYTRSRIDSERSVNFPGFRDQLSARYDAATRQGFVEGAYRVRGRSWSLEPYLQYARVNVDSDAIRELGGAAALRGRVSDTRSNLTTLGLRFEQGGRPQQRDWLHLRIGLGYRYATGDLAGRGYMGWNGGTVFGVSGAPIARRSLAAEIGLLFQLNPRQQLELGYSGQYANAAKDDGVNARWSMQF
jgi:subtilase-type serine protease